VTDARDRIALRIEETRALLPFVEPGSVMAAVVAARIGGYETALADIAAWRADGEDEEAEPEPAPPAEAPAPPSPVHGGGVGWGDQPTPQLAAPLGPIGGAGAIVWTAERDDLVIRDYGRLGGLAMLPALNALPGEPVKSAQAVKNRAGVLRARGVPVPPRPTGRPPSAAPAAPREPTPPTTIPDDEIAEARDMMRASAKCGARDLHDYFGWPLPQAQQAAEAIRAELKAAA
jgi:hypothetical protein